MTEPKKSPKRAGLVAVFGALALTLLCIAGSIGFLYWRGGEQRRVLDDRSGRCRKGDAAACDSLRSVCLKRNGDSCAALAFALLEAGPRQDTNDAVRLYGEACTYRNRDACYRAGALYLEGKHIPQDKAQAARVLDRGCELGLHEACALRQTIP